LTPYLCWAVAALLLAPAGCSPGEAPETGPTAEVQQGRLERLVVATGTIEPESEVEVRPRISGIVEKIHVEPGDDVQPGQPLLEIDRELLEVQAEEAKAQLEAAQVERHYATTAKERASALHERGAIAEQELETAQARFDTANANVARARAKLNSLRVQLRHASVVASLAGTVLDVYVEEGSAVSAVTAPTGGSRLLSVARTDALHLEGLVDENEVAAIRVGQPARVRTEAFGDDVFEGRVRKISPIGERRQNVTYFEVEIEIRGSERSKLRPRMSADADIVTEVIEEARWIPETALLYDGDRIYVEVPDGSPEGYAQRDVKLGVLDHDRVQVVTGLELGEEVRLK
jgi:HlyD family secretion protein